MHRFAPGLPAFSWIGWGEVRRFLSQHVGGARPDTLLCLRLEEVEAIAAEFGVSVVDAPWAREIEPRAPDGKRMRIGTPKG